METIKLRPHHLLCQEFFIGHGYSDEFVKNMQEVISYLRENNPLVELVTKGDVLCNHCPNLIDGVCKDITKVLKYDENVGRIIGKVNGIYRYNDLRKLIKEKIISSYEIKDVCQNCQWAYICEDLRGKM